MSYENFLIERRKRMALVVRDGYLRLADPTYQPDIVLPEPPADEEVPEVTMLDLLAAGLVRASDLITPVQAVEDIVAEITEDGEILIDDKAFDTPDRAARAVGDETVSGWDYWGVLSPDGLVSLRDLASKLEDV